MANTLVLEQHFYGSAPLGLATSRGFQTIARSRGLGNEAALETHCLYRRPAASRDGPFPVSWGWFNLDGERACLHRIGYAGTDEGGRPGNFLAHNFVVRRADLDAIDFDVPALFRWVSQDSPCRYGCDGEEKSGFARNYRQLYAVHGQDRTRLQTFEPLEAPTAKVLAVRAEMDAEAEQDLRRVLAALSPARLTALLNCLLCPAEQRRLVLLVGLGQGQDDSLLERKLLEVLFGLLPLGCRHDLTYSTYESDPASLLAIPPGQARATPPGYKQRRLVLTPAGTDLRLPHNPRLWLIPATDKPAPTTPSSELARELVPAVQPNSWPTVLAWRETACCFHSPDEPLLRSLWRLCQADHVMTEGDYRAVARMPLPDRPDRREVLDLVGRLVPGAESTLAPDSPALSEVGRQYLQLVETAPPLSPDERTHQALAATCRWSVRPGQVALFERWLELIDKPVFQNLTPLLFRAFCQANAVDEPGCQAMQRLAREWQREPFFKQRCEAVQYYNEEGGDLLVKRLLDHARTLSPECLVQTHGAVLLLARGNDQPTLTMESHLCSLLGLLLADPRVQSLESLRDPLEWWLRWYEDRNDRIQVWGQIVQVAREVGSSDRPAWTTRQLRELLTAEGMEPEEARWYAGYLELGLRELLENATSLRERTTAEVLFEVPGLAEAPATAFQQWFVDQLRPAVWKRVAEKVEAQWRDLPEATLAFWFQGGDRDVLLGNLADRGLLGGPIDALQARCTHAGWAGLMLLGDLLRKAGAARQVLPDSNLDALMRKLVPAFVRFLTDQPGDGGVSDGG